MSTHSDSEDDVPLAQRAAPATKSEPAVAGGARPAGQAAQAAQNNGIARPASAGGTANGLSKPAAHLAHGRQVVSDSEDDMPLAARPAATKAAPAAAAKQSGAATAAPKPVAAGAAGKPAAAKPAAAPAPKRRPGLLDDAVELPSAPPKPKPKPAPAAPAVKKEEVDSDSEEDEPLAKRKAKVTPGGC